MPEDLCYLEGKYLEDYLHDVEICQAFAKRSREKMAEVLIERTGMTEGESYAYKLGVKISEDEKREIAQEVMADLVMIYLEKFNEL